MRLVIAIACAAGGYLTAFKRMRKDVNGIGKRQREFEKNSTLAHLTHCPPELRADIAIILKGKD